MPAEVKPLGVLGRSDEKEDRDAMDAREPEREEDLECAILEISIFSMCGLRRYD